MVSLTPWMFQDKDSADTIALALARKDMQQQYTARVTAPAAKRQDRSFEAQLPAMQVAYILRDWAPQAQLPVLRGPDKLCRQVYPPETHLLSNFLEQVSAEAARLICLLPVAVELHERHRQCKKLEIYTGQNPRQGVPWVQFCNQHAVVCDSTVFSQLGMRFFDEPLHHCDTIWILLRLVPTEIVEARRLVDLLPPGGYDWNSLQLITPNMLFANLAHMSCLLITQTSMLAVRLLPVAHSKSEDVLSQSLLPGQDAHAHAERHGNLNPIPHKASATYLSEPPGKRACLATVVTENGKPT